MDAGGRHSCQPIPLQKDRETGPEQALVSEQRDISVKAVKALNDIGVRVVEVYHRHQKVIIIDEHTVMLGSLNALSPCAAAGAPRRAITTTGAATARPARGSNKLETAPTRADLPLKVPWECYERNEG